MGFQDDEVLNMYLEEAREHLAGIENDLLVIEENGSEIDEGLVNKVFRAAHSVKGGASFMGLNKIKELAHKIENVLGMIRDKEIVPNPEIVNILLLSFDQLRDMINNVETSEETDISEHTVALTGLTTAFLPADEKETVSKEVEIRFPDGRTMFTISEFDLAQSKKNGRIVYFVEYDLIHDIHYQDKTLMDLLRNLQDSGIIIASRVDISAVGSLEDSATSNRIPFLVLIATVMERDIIGALFEVEDSYIHTLGEDNVLYPLHSELPGAGGAAEPEMSLPEAEEAQTASAETAPPPPPEEETPETKPSKKAAPPVEKPETESPAAVKRKEPAGKEEAAKQLAPADMSLRVQVGLLDNLMTLAGELVLSRNQLMQSVSAGDRRALEIASQKIDLVTSELQEAIMMTRMQPIGNILGKFPRVVRDLARDLGKEVKLTLEGNEVELDKTILEGLSDPLTHLVRNSVDHGIEAPDVRTDSGKNVVGHVLLKAYHEAGQVNIEIQDDGAGIDPERVVTAALSKGLITDQQARLMSVKEKLALILMPGLSTAKKVSDVSGRGVGMDVVKTNLDRLGGVVDIESEMGKGTVIRIKLPLTLAIIASLLVAAGKERFAVPQVNLDELLRIPAAQVKDRIERVGDAEVVRLRGKLLPLVRLSDVLGIGRTYTDPESGDEKPDRRANIADRRSATYPFFEEGEEAESSHVPRERRDDGKDRRYQSSSAVNVTVVSAGAFKYGLVVEEFHDSEEIVVKPLGRHLKQCEGYAGATILGDGRVALILDVGGLARVAGLTSLEGTDRASELAREEAAKARTDKHAFLLFMSGEGEQFAVPLELVERVEDIRSTDIERVGGRRTIHYRGGSLPVFSLDEAAAVNPLAERENLVVIVFKIAGREVGLLGVTPLDAVELAIDIDDSTLRQPGIMGSAIVGEKTTLLVEVFELMETLNPGWFEHREPIKEEETGSAPIVLVVEDSEFFLNQVRRFIEEEGYKVVTAMDGVEAWNVLNETEGIRVVVTDIEMPNMDGYELAKKIRSDSRFSHLPVVAVTSLAGEEDIAKGVKAGIDDYQIKLDKEKLLKSIYEFLQR